MLEIIINQDKKRINLKGYDLEKYYFMPKMILII